MEEKYPACFAAKCKDDGIRQKSQSGGMFILLSDIILEQNGVIYGCELDNHFMAKHAKAITKEERNKFCGSKYIESDLNTMFKEVKSDLESGKSVLFSGTSCQIAGLKSFLSNVDTEKLVLVDIICHGVPSPLIWQEYLKWNEEKYGSCIEGVNFRNKQEFGWGCLVETLYFKDRQVNASYFSLLFHRHNILRPACFKCPYKSILHPGDITIGDCWGIENVKPDFKDNNGVSLVLINSKKGEWIFEMVKEKCDFFECDVQRVLQRPLVSPFEKPDEREEFWKEYRISSFDKVLRKHARFELKVRIKRKVKKGMKFWMKLVKK